MEPRQQIASAEEEGDGVTTPQWLRSPTAAVDRRCVHPEPFFRHHRLPKKQELHRPPALRPTRTADLREELKPRHASATPREAGAMRLVPPNDDEDHVVPDSCDVDMGTPTAANEANADWRDVSERDGKQDKPSVGGGWRAQEHRDAFSLRPSESHSPLSHKPIFGENMDTNANDHDAKEEQLLAFREYGDADIDSIGILPSQDFAGETCGDDADSADDKALSTTTNPKSSPQSSLWLDIHDGTQLQEEESSEIFDNIIYAPPASQQRAQIHEPKKPALSSSSPPSKAPQIYPDDLYEDESDLSDADELGVPLLLGKPRCGGAASPPAPTRVSKTPPAVSSRESNTVCSPPRDPLHLCARMSIKRDCSFIDHTLKHRRKHVSVQDLSESGEEFEEKLKLVDGDEERDGEGQVPKRPSTVLHSSRSAAVDAGLLLPGFRPKKKRRKIRQLALDAFLKIQPSATY